MRNIVPVLTVVATLIALWYAGAVALNAPWAYDKAARAEVTLSQRQDAAKGDDDESDCNGGRSGDGSGARLGAGLGGQSLTP